MNQRFRNEEIKRVAELYAENELYQAVCSIGSQLEAELTDFGLCPEECFMDVLELLSAIADKGEDFSSEVDNCWLHKFNEYRRFDRSVSKVETCKAVGIVFGFAILATDSSRHPFYRYTLSRQLMEAIANHQFCGWQSTLDRIFSVPLKDDWFDAFLEEEPEGDADRLPLPKAVDTNRAQKYFRIAIEKGYMKCEDGRFSWIGLGNNAQKSQLAYFLGLVFGYRHSVSGNIGTEFPAEELNTLFGENKLYNLLVQVHQAQKEQKWRALIDDMFK